MNSTQFSITRDYSYYQRALESLPLPLAYIDLDVLAENALKIRDGLKGKNLRLASKSIRSVAMIQHIQKLMGAALPLMCFSLGEAVHLAGLGFYDLLVAYPTLDLEGLKRCGDVLTSGAQLVTMVDAAEQVELLDQVGREVGCVFPVCLDIDMSWHLPGLNFGVYRSPLRHVTAVLELYRVIDKHKHVSLQGVMGYEAQIAGVCDRMPGQVVKNMVVRLLKHLSLGKVAETREKVLAALKEAGANIRFVNGGGTGSLQSTVLERDVSEVTVGSGFYHSHLFDYYKDIPYAPAAGFALEVVRKPKPGMITCLGGGYVASGAPGWDKVPQPYLPPGLAYVSNEGAGEVQTPLRGENLPDLGQPVFFRHSKAGELCERFTHLHLISNGKVVDKVTTYRGDGLCFI